MGTITDFPRTRLLERLFFNPPRVGDYVLIPRLNKHVHVVTWVAEDESGMCVYDLVTRSTSQVVNFPEIYVPYLPVALSVSLLHLECFVRCKSVTKRGVVVKEKRRPDTGRIVGVKISTASTWVYRTPGRIILTGTKHLQSRS